LSALRHDLFARGASEPSFARHDAVSGRCDRTRHVARRRLDQGRRYRRDRNRRHRHIVDPARGKLGIARNHTLTGISSAARWGRTPGGVLLAHNYGSMFSNPSALLGSLLFGAVGFVAFMYGKKMVLW